MKTIGLIDYYISEWHANNYPIWIREICEKNGAQFEVKYAWAETDVSPVDGKTTDQWCEEFGVEKCASIDELCEKSDYIIVLAPSNPEKHLGYAKEALKYKKNTYIDKTFAPDYATAKEIFDIAKEYGTRFFSTSALRYGTELNDLVGSKNIVTTGGGGSIEEYIIHQAEMVVKLTDAEPISVSVRRQGGQYLCHAKLEGGYEATMVYACGLPFTVSAELATGTTRYRSVASDFFKLLIADILHFFETGETSFDTAQTLKVMKLREAVIRACENEEKTTI
jgi:hypothetical protein